MRVDPNTFRVSLDKMSQHLVTDDKKSTHASRMSAVSHIPAIVVCVYMLEFLYPNEISLLEMRTNLIDFYGYTEIVPFER